MAVNPSSLIETVTPGRAEPSLASVTRPRTVWAAKGTADSTSRRTQPSFCIESPFDLGVARSISKWSAPSSAASRHLLPRRRRGRRNSHSREPSPREAGRGWRVAPGEGHATKGSLHRAFDQRQQVDHAGFSVLPFCDEAICAARAADIPDRLTLGVADRSGGLSQSGEGNLLAGPDKAGDPDDFSGRVRLQGDRLVLGSPQQPRLFAPLALFLAFPRHVDRQAVETAPDFFDIGADPNPEDREQQERAKDRPLARAGPLEWRHHRRSAVNLDVPLRKISGVWRLAGDLDAEEVIRALLAVVLNSHLESHRTVTDGSSAAEGDLIRPGFQEREGGCGDQLEVFHRVAILEVPARRAVDVNSEASHLAVDAAASGHFHSRSLGGRRWRRRRWRRGRAGVDRELRPAPSDVSLR